jgi:hypothetical protein
MRRHSAGPSIPWVVTAWLAACHPAPSMTSESAGAPPRPGRESAASVVPIPGGEGGIGFDDLRYSSRLGRVLVPAGRTGALCLVDPGSGSVDRIAGFGEAEGFSGGHGDGTTSVDEGLGLLFAIDRTSKRVDVVDPAARSILAYAALAGDPDYVRFVASTRELWVTEPDAEQIEVFDLGPTPRASPRSVGVIAVPGGPESLVVDETRHRAYTHLWEGATLAIDLHARTTVSRWPNGCSGSRGIALDEHRGFLFVGCAEGQAVVLDVAHDGNELSRAATGKGVDIIDYDPARGHLYVPGAKSATLTILGVSVAGQLSVLGAFPAVKGAHCATTDGKGRVFVGDPGHGRLLVVADEFPASLH